METTTIEGRDTRVAQWVLNTIGRALLVAMVIPVVILALAIALDHMELVAIAAIVGPPIFAWQLATARAPARQAS